MARMRVPAILSVTILLAAACGGSSSPSEESSPTSSSIIATEAPQPDGDEEGEVWEGTAKTTVTNFIGAGGCPNPFHQESVVRLVVAQDGSVAATFDNTGCGVAYPHFDFTGTATDAGFVFSELTLFTEPGSLIPKVSPTRAEATLTHTDPDAMWVITWELTCKTCG